jgi:hypothetical protein
VRVQAGGMPGHTYVDGRGVENAVMVGYQSGRILVVERPALHNKGRDGATVDGRKPGLHGPSPWKLVPTTWEWRGIEHWDD